MALRRMRFGRTVGEPTIEIYLPDLRNIADPLFLIFSFAAGCCPVARLQRAGVKAGL